MGEAAHDRVDQRTAHGFPLEDPASLRALIREEVLKILAENEKGMGTCAFCWGSFPEYALNYSSGDPACMSCQNIVVKHA